MKNEQKLLIVEPFQNTTIEERVTLLEIQVIVIQDDLTGLDEDVNGVEVDLTELEGDVNFLFDEQVIQDERLFNLEQENDVIDTRLLIIDNDLEGEFIELINSFYFGSLILVGEKTYFQRTLKCRLLCFDIERLIDLQAAASSLDFRVTALEENGGSGGNSSVAELEVRVETLEGTTADHETRISASEVDINGKTFSFMNMN